jgi:hypothetical protein
LPVMIALYAVARMIRPRPPSTLPSARVR